MDLNSGACCASPPCLRACSSSTAPGDEQSLQLFGPRLFARLEGGGRKASSVRVVVVQHSYLICDRVAAPEPQTGRIR